VRERQQGISRLMEIPAEENHSRQLRSAFFEEKAAGDDEPLLCACDGNLRICKFNG